MSYKVRAIKKHKQTIKYQAGAFNVLNDIVFVYNEMLFEHQHGGFNKTLKSKQIKQLSDIGKSIFLFFTDHAGC